MFEGADVDLSRPMVSTCGSGITAAVVSFAAHLLNNQVPLYDVRIAMAVLVVAISNL